MSSGPSTKSVKSSTRERILGVALDLFVEQGFGGTTISEVERRVGLAAGTGSFYRHFSSKEALLRAAVDHEVKRCLLASDEERATLPTPDDPVEGFTVVAEQVLRDLRRFHRLFHLMLTDGERVPEVRDAIVTALQGSGAVAWMDDPVTMVGITALLGFHVFGLFGGSAMKVVSKDEFIRALAKLTENTGLFLTPPRT